MGKNLTVIRRFGHIKFTIFLANQMYFSSWFVWFKGIPIFLGGYAIGALLVINLISSHATKFKFSKSYIGIFLIHFGLVLLIIGAGLTSFFAKEMQMVVAEGSVKNYLEYPTQFEFVLIDVSNPTFDDVYAFDIDELKSGIQFKGAKIQMTEYFTNSILNQRGIENLKYSQLGQSFKLISLPNTYKMTERNIPGLALSIKTERDTNFFILWGGSAVYQHFNTSNQTYLIKLRPKRHYIDFSIELVDFLKENYSQSTTARSFQSRINLITSSGSVPFIIQMNEPLRYNGLTFFQSSFTTDEQSSVFQVVKNPSWVVPYISSLIIVVGLFIQMIFSMRGEKR
jgi:hypothetical protein